LEGPLATTKTRSIRNSLRQTGRSIRTCLTPRFRLPLSIHHRPRTVPAAAAHFRQCRSRVVISIGHSAIKLWQNAPFEHRPSGPDRPIARMQMLGCMRGDTTSASSSKAAEPSAENPRPLGRLPRRATGQQSTTPQSLRQLLLCCPATAIPRLPTRFPSHWSLRCIDATSKPVLASLCASNWHASGGVTT
jgi:hypothetical protein